ncbi:MAG: alpha/beta hydrolase [Candidatus Rokuibacteriota bacterium]|nr:MAG: alpha/beta hydrolase [Candidatus Rokubacteria bacterium]
MSELDRRTFIKAAAASTAAVALSRLVKPETVVAATPTRGSVVTNDGVTLRYDEAGSGKPLVCIPGWSQTAAQWKHQVSGLSDRYRVIAVDMRGHGESTKPDHGYTIQRLAKDVQDLLVALNLTDVTVMGHSMGCSVMWSYWELWGADRLAKLVLVDQMPMITADPAWSPEEKDDAGAIFDPTSLYATIDKLAGPEGAKTTGGFIGAMFTKTYPRDDLAWVVTQNLKMPREYAAALLLNHSSQDWRRLIPRITVPTLVVGGRVSVVPWKSQVWVHNQIRGSRLEIFEENEGGNHFMFMENPEKFNRVVREFIG